MTPRPRIVLIHATPVAVEPIREAFARLWPEAETVNLLDDSLSTDRAASQTLTDEMQRRFDTLADYSVGIGAAGILFTCSAFGPAIEAVARRLSIPVLKPNEAMYEAALALGRRIGMVATFAPAADSMLAEFHEDAARLQPDATIDLRVVPDAMAALRSGDEARHNALVADEVRKLSGVDVVMLAHFSTARALEKSTAAGTCPILTSPDAAIRKMRSLTEAAKSINPGGN